MCCCECGGRFIFVSASLVLTLTSILVGISFFGPFWLGNVQKGKDGFDLYITDSSGVVSLVSQKPDRGLWAQCGKECTWFWQDGYKLQEQKFTKLKWHLATQVLYFVAATLILVSEIFARVQMCCHGEDSKCVFFTLGSLVLSSVVLQVAALATFGGGSAGDPYNAESNPVTITKIIRNEFTDNSAQNGQNYGVYLGWCYWMAVTGAITSLVAGILFLFAGCCRGKGGCCTSCCDEDCYEECCCNNCCSSLCYRCCRCCHDD